MREIKLTKGKVALVDDADYEWLVGLCKWQATSCRDTSRPGSPEKWYAQGWLKDAEKGRKSCYMHRVITACPKGLVVDHLDSNGLNNQRANFEVVTQGENLRRARERMHKRLQNCKCPQIIDTSFDIEELMEDHEDDNTVEWV